MRRWWNRIFFVVIVLIAAFSIYAVWPNEPDRYLPSAIPWPSGRGLPGKIGPFKLPCYSGTTTTNPAADCRGMTLGLDLQGGSRITLQADVSGAGKTVTSTELSQGMDAAKQIIENRVNPLGVSEAQVQRSGTDKLVVELPGVTQQQATDITRPAVLEFCEPVQQGGQGTSTAAGTAIAVVPNGTKVYYRPESCEPDIDTNGMLATYTCTINVTPCPNADQQPAKDAKGNIVRVKPTYVPIGGLGTSFSVENIVWTPAKGNLNGVPTIMTGNYLKPNAQIGFDQLGAPLLDFNMTSQGEQIFGSLSQRLIGMPLATFLDGDPIRGTTGQILAPTIQSQITSSGQTTGLSLSDAQRLRTFLNNGAFPIPLKIIEQQTVDATLGATAVLHSVQAGLVALLLIMAFMILYYRLPGVLAALALIVYTAVVLAIFKIGLPGSGPVTLTLAGIAAFVLSVGMAVDANILIFERSKEELRNGRSLIPAVETGFARAWPSIRDSNSSTLITCGILYWMGNAFQSSLIKGFALTLAIGVVISLFSAITVTRTFLRLALSTPLTRQLWLWTDDKPDTETPISTLGAPGLEGMEGADHA